MEISHVCFTLQKVKDYFADYFVGDLNRYYIQEQTDNGIVYISSSNISFEYNSPVVRHKCVWWAAALHEAPSTYSLEDERIPDGNQEDELIFIGIISALFECQQHLVWTFSDNVQLSKFFQSMRIPLICQAVRDRNLDDFLANSRLHYILDKPNDAKQYRKMIEVTYPFVTEFVTQNLRIWENHLFEDKKGYLSSPADQFEKEMRDVLFHKIRTLTPQTGMSGIQFCPKMFVEYIEKDFTPQFNLYFNNHNLSEGYSKILCLDYIHQKRIIDGKPGKSIQENIMFSVTTLFMIFAEQSIELYAPYSQELFHKASGWPLIYSGPGGGYMIHGMMMIDIAGLAPLYEESLFYISALDSAEQYMTEYFNSIINNKPRDPQNKEVYDKLNASIDSSKKKLIKKQMLEFILQSKCIIKKHIENPNLSWQQIITILYEGFTIDKCALDNRRTP